MVQIMRGNMLHVFPQLENVKIDYGWAGPIDMTMNASPHFGRISRIFTLRKVILDTVSLSLDLQDALLQKQF